MNSQLLIIIFFLPFWSLSQKADTLLNEKNVSEKSIEKIKKNFDDLQNKVEKKTLKTLERFDKEEQRLLQKLSKKDSVMAKLLNNTNTKVASLSSKFTQPAKLQKLKSYIPGFDSLKTGLDFLDNAKDLQSKFPKEWGEKIITTKASVAGLEHSLQSATDIKKILQQRKAELKKQFEKLGMAKELKKLNKEVYYYQQQLNEYKAVLKDPKKLEQRAITELKKLPAFAAFMKKNSQLAAMFALPENYGTPASLAGLQTRAAIQSQIQGRFAGTGVNPQQYVQQQMQQANAEINKLKEKVKNLPNSPLGDGGEMPDFKPNTQKTKTFMQRLEYGANIQSQKTNGWMPVTSDVALTVGYKLNDRSVIGLGASYKVGWGKDWKHIKVSNEGASLRSYIDWKLNSIFGKIEGFWISGGYEQNYIPGLKALFVSSPAGGGRKGAAWQSNGLIGISKKIKIGKRVQNTQLLWDFMSYRQVPRSPAILFRTGFGF